MLSKLRFGLLLVLIMLSGSFAISTPRLSTDQILNLVNKDREAYGLPKLSNNPTLNKAAYAKAQDMLAFNYFDHISPTGTKPWQFFKSSGYNYVYAGENLAINFTDANDLESSWMESPKHRDNILSPNFSEVGLAVVEQGGKIIIVQFFGSKDSRLTYEK